MQQSEGQADGQTVGQTDRQSDREMDRQPASHWELCYQPSLLALTRFAVQLLCTRWRTYIEFDYGTPGICCLCFLLASCINAELYNFNC